MITIYRIKLLSLLESLIPIPHTVNSEGKETEVFKTPKKLLYKLQTLSLD